MTENLENDLFDINSSSFDSEAFVNSLLKKKGLDELVAVEEDMVVNVRRLDSEMQQLVYENYNKFLTATNTVKNMQKSFSDMDNEMQGLSNRMKKISSLSDSLSQMFENNRETVRELSKKNKIIQSLQYFVQLPNLLQLYTNEKNYKKAVELYTCVCPKLELYKNYKPMSGIYSNCNEIANNLKTQLFERLISSNSSSEEVVETVQLLKNFDVSTTTIQTQLIKNWQKQLYSELKNLSDENCNHAKTNYVDILEFVDIGCCTFLTNLSLYISLYMQLFYESSEKIHLMELIDKCMLQFEEILIKKFLSEENFRECALFVKALDRISRKIAVISRILPGLDFSMVNTNIVIKSTQHQIKICRNSIKNNILDTLNDFLQALKDTFEERILPEKFEENLLWKNQLKINEKKSNEKLFSYIAKLEQTFLVMVKTSLANLLLFNANDMNFCHIDPIYFENGGTFSRNVYENVVAGSIIDLEDLLIETKKTFVNFFLTKNFTFTNSCFFLCFAAFLYNIKEKHLQYLIDLSQEQFKLTESINLHGKKEQKVLTVNQDLKRRLNIYIQRLLHDYVETICNILNDLLTKLFESFDWENCNNTPRTVRISIKHFLSCLQTLNTKICCMTGETDLSKKDQVLTETSKNNTLFPNEIKRTESLMSNTITNTYETISLNSSSFSGGGVNYGIMEKLWTEELDDVLDTTDGEKFTSVETVLEKIVLQFSRDSIMGAITQICLTKLSNLVNQCKTKFSECGLQQLQIDCAYLKLYLWELASDEQSLNNLIENCVTAAVSKCLTPKLLDPTTVRTICEQC